MTTEIDPYKLEASLGLLEAAGFRIDISFLKQSQAGGGVIKAYVGASPLHVFYKLSDVTNFRRREDAIDHLATTEGYSEQRIYDLLIGVDQNCRSCHKYLKPERLTAWLRDEFPDMVCADCAGEAQDEPYRPPETPDADEEALGLALAAKASNGAPWNF